MERTGQVVVLAVIIAALGLFGLRLFAGSDQDSAFFGSGSASGSGSAFGPVAGGEESTGSYGSAAGYVAGRRGEGAGGTRPGYGARVGSDRSGSTSASGRSAAVARGGARTGGGTLGSSSSQRRGAAGQRLARLSGSSGGRLRDEPRRSRAGGGSDLIDTLASQPLAPVDDEVDPDVGSEEGTLLSLPMNEDDASRDFVDDEKPEENPTFEKEVERAVEGYRFTEDSVLAFPVEGNIRGEQGTISFEIEPEFAGGDPTDHFLVQMRTPNAWENRMEILKNGRYLRFVHFDETGRESGISVPIDDWVANESHRVAVTWDEEAQLASMYIDGRLAGQTEIQGSLRPDPNATLYVGSDLPQNRRGFRGTMRDFQVKANSEF